MKIQIKKNNRWSSFDCIFTNNHNRTTGYAMGKKIDPALETRVPRKKE
jgi:hypothetical protein